MIAESILRFRQKWIKYCFFGDSASELEGVLRLLEWRFITYS